MHKVRGFEVCSKYRHQDVILPQRATVGSAGYDIRSIQDITVNPYWYYTKMASVIKAILAKEQPKEAKQSIKKWIQQHPKAKKLVTLVHTGIKVYTPQNEFLGLFNRSSNPIKRGLVLINGTGIIDSDYYNNPSNEGELCAEFINIGKKPWHIHKGDKIMQGIFLPFYLADDDHPLSAKRKGGLGSTGTK